MSDQLNRATIVKFTGAYHDSEGREHQADELELAYLDHQYALTDSMGWVAACPTDKEDVDVNEVTIDIQDWDEAVCKQTGGHNYVDWQWDESTPESACQICTRCGDEIPV